MKETIAEFLARGGTVTACKADPRYVPPATMRAHRTGLAVLSLTGEPLSTNQSAHRLRSPNE